MRYHQSIENIFYCNINWAAQMRRNAAPVGLTIHGKLYLYPTADTRNDITKIPPNTTIDGNVFISDLSNISIFPRGFRCTGELNISLLDIQALPDDIIVEGTIVMSNSSYSSIMHHWGEKRPNGVTSIQRVRRRSDW